MSRPNISADLDWVDPEVPGAIARFGMLGRATRAGAWRLYLTPDLNEYLEFREEDLIHHERMQTPLGGTIVWLKPDAKPKYWNSRPQQAQAGFLMGPMTTGYLRGTAAAAARVRGVGGIGGGAIFTGTIIDTFISFLVACPSYWFGCTQNCTLNCQTVTVCPLCSLFCTYEKQVCG